LAARFVAARAVDLEVHVGAEAVARVSVAPGGWTEAAFELPERVASDAMTVSVVDTTGEGFGSAHYWLYER
jgi:hypothetical protein